MKSRKWIIAALLLAIGVWASTPSRIAHSPPLGAENALNLASEALDGLVPGTEKRITWHGEQTRTEWAIVSLHGFSATRQETAPLATDLASTLNANLFEARLSGHGLQSNGMTDVSAEVWLDDAAQALAIGAEIGDKVIVLAVSTGATLAASLLDHEAMLSVDTLVFVSPNYFPKDPNAAWMTRPFGKLMTRLIVGKTRSWEPYNEAQGTYWTTSYPSATLVEAMRLVDYANAQLPADIAQRLLVFYSPLDQVISVDALLHAFEQTSSPQKKLVVVEDPGDPSKHVLAGDALSPNKTQWMVGEIVRFLVRETEARSEL